MSSQLLQVSFAYQPSRLAPLIQLPRQIHPVLKRCERQPGGAERTRICLQNLTGSNLQYEFRANIVDDYANSLSPRSGTLGPNAFQCGNATDYPLSTETWVRFRADEPGAPWTYRVGFSDSSAAREQCWYWSDDMKPDVDGIILNPYTADSVVYYDFNCFGRGKRQLSGPARGGNFNLVVDIAGAPRTFGSIRAYQADVRVLPG